MDNKRPQLSVDELHQLKWLLGGVLALLAVWTVLYMDIEAGVLMGITTAATLAVLVWPGLPAKVPDLAHTLAFPAIVAFFVIDLWLRTEVLPAMVRLDILLLLYRSISYRQRRDDLQIIVLGLFLIVVAGVLTVSLVFALQILAYTACALAFLLVITLTEAVGGARRLPILRGRGATPDWVGHADWPRLFRRLRTVADWRVVGLGAVLFAGVVGVSALLFLAIPRFQIENSMLLDRFISKKAKTGFSDSIRFGEVTEIQQDNSVALSVDISDPDRAQVSAAPYWRMLVLDEYRDGVFKVSSGLRIGAFGRLRTDTQMYRQPQPHAGEAVYWRFYLEPGVSRFLPLPGPFEVLQFTEPQNFHLAEELSLVALRDEPVTMTAYQVQGIDASGQLPDPAFAMRFRTRKQPATILFGDADHATLARLKDEVTNNERMTAEEFARKAGTWLRSRHAYTLSPRIPPGEGDPLVRWVASREAGHCELFAGSFVLLAKAAGFPARVVTGFRGGTWNAFSRNFTVRNSDAHAWAEIFDAVSGAWLRADPLEPATTSRAGETKGEAALTARADRSWSARFDSLRVFWYRRIVSFDQRSQAETLRAVKEATENSGRRLRALVENGIEATRQWLSSPWNGRRLMNVSGAVLLLTGPALAWRRYGVRGWRRMMRGVSGRREDPVRREAGRLLVRTRHEWPEAEDERLAAQRELQRLRFGARETWSDPEQIFRRARRLLRRRRTRVRRP